MGLLPMRARPAPAAPPHSREQLMAQLEHGESQLSCPLDGLNTTSRMGWLPQ